MTLRIILTDGDGIQGLAATFGAVVQTNIIQTAADAAAAAASASQAATSATNASNSAGAASASASSAATSASNASGSASAAAGSATAAGTSATNASNSASAASASASAASTSATNAATSATNASNSATAAATSASNAAATLANALTKANNLSDVTSAATARTNLAVPGLATANVFTNDQTYQKASPTLVLSDTAQSSGNGIFRMRSITNVLNFQRNTAVAGDFSTLTTPLQVSGTDVLILSQRPTFNGATPWDSANLNFAAPPAIGATTPSTGKFTTLQATGTITPSSTAGIVGTTTNDSAAAGSVGEIVSATATAVAITSNIATNVTSISLTAGDWEVTGLMGTAPAGSTTQSAVYAGPSTTSAAFQTLSGSFLNLAGSAAPVNAGGVMQVTLPATRFSLSAPTTVFMVASVAYAVSTLTVNGFLRARRVR